MSICETHANAEMLRDIYADLTRLAEYADDDIALHTADRRPGDLPVVGRDAVARHEQELIRATGDTLFMDVQHIVANDHFGAVLGVLRATVHGRTVGMPFCGLWRFRDHRIVEHWENAYDASALGRFLAGEARCSGAAE